MRIALLQQNFIVGDIVGNSNKIFFGLCDAEKYGADLVVSSELAPFGYPSKDLLLRSTYLKEQDRCLRNLKTCMEHKHTGAGLILGVAEQNTGNGKPLFNSAMLLDSNNNTHPLIVRRKELLPTYDVFDETRYFEPGNEGAKTFRYKEKNIAVLMCEDIWGGSETPNARKPYRNNPLLDLINHSVVELGRAGQHIDVLIVLNGSPYYWGKGAVRFELVSGIAKKLNCAVVYVNQVGGNDDLVFDGRSFAVNKYGTCIGAAKAFEEDLIIIDTDSNETAMYHLDKVIETKNRVEAANSVEDLHQAIVLGTRDYVYKTEHDSAIVALSGGIDSAVTAEIAVAALGKENVIGVGMPSPYSSQGSIDDARELAKNLGIEFMLIPIWDIYEAIGKALKPHIGWYEAGAVDGDVTEENAQARVRGLLVMAMTNRKYPNKKPLLLSTGNKSEVAVGYCTLYGDMAGGLGVISDVLKTNVYELARYANRNGIVIPLNTIEKPPSAELRPGQIDQDSLPPYNVLDPILELYLEQMMGCDDIVRQKFDRAIVERVIAMVNRAEFKRKQSAHGLKVTAHAFGSGHRWPIAAKSL